MDVQPVGTGPVNPDAPVQSALSGGAAPAFGLARSPAVLTGLASDSVAGFLEQLATPAIENLLDHLDAQRAGVDPKLLDTLLQAANSAVLERDLPRALAKLSELVALDPERGAALATRALSGQTPMASIHLEVHELLDRLALSAKVDAEKTLTAAYRAMESGGARELRQGDPDPRMVLTIAEKLLDSGTHINSLRAEELSQFVVAYYDFSMPRAGRARQAAKASPGSPPQRSGAKRRRVPVPLIIACLLLALAAWLALRYFWR